MTLEGAVGPNRHPCLPVESGIANMLESRGCGLFFCVFCKRKKWNLFVTRSCHLSISLAVLSPSHLSQPSPFSPHSLAPFLFSLSLTFLMLEQRASGHFSSCRRHLIIIIHGVGKHDSQKRKERIELINKNKNLLLPRVAGDVEDFDFRFTEWHRYC
jgi:hypothetical protein